VTRLILALVLFVTTAQADCLAQPTQTCVFQMALQQADAAERPVNLISGYLAVAFLQEAERQGDAATTRDALLQHMQHMDPKAASTALGIAVVGLVLTQYPKVDGPETNQWISQALPLLNGQGDAPEPGDGTTALQAKVRAKVAAVQADAVPKYARVLAAGLPQRNSLNVYFGVLHQIQDREKAMTLTWLIQKQALTAARAEALSWPDPADRSVGLAYLASNLAEVGQVDGALQLLAMVDPALLGAEGLEYLAETYAYAGQADKVEEFLNQMAPTAPVSQRIKYRVIAAMVSGDYGRARELIQDASQDSAKWLLLYGIDAAMTAGAGNMDRFVAKLPDRLRLQGLYAIGYHQAEIGDAEAAMKTQARLVKSGFSKPEADLRPRIAPILAATGHEVEAVQMAHDLNLAPVTALVAAGLK
jgi:hypothetical protein